MSDGSAITVNAAAAAMYAALATARENATRVPKRGRNDRFGYDYSSADDVAAVTRDALKGTGIALVIIDQKVVWKTEGSGELVCEMLLTHAQGYAINCTHRWPVSITMSKQGTAIESPDIAVRKAATSLTSYFWLRTLGLDRGNEDAERLEGLGTSEVPQQTEEDRCEAFASEVIRRVAGMHMLAQIEQAWERMADLAPRLGEQYGRVEKALTEQEKRIRGFEFVSEQGKTLMRQILDANPNLLDDWESHVLDNVTNEVDREACLGAVQRGRLKAAAAAGTPAAAPPSGGES